MANLDYLPMCRDCWEYYGKPSVYAVGIIGGSCRRCGEPNDYRVPRMGEDSSQDDPMSGLHPIPVEVILAKDGKLPEPKTEEKTKDADGKPFRFGIGRKGIVA